MYIWGEGYKIVMKKMGRSLPVLDDNLLQKIITTVFPKGVFARREYVEHGNIPPCSMMQLEEAVKQMGKRKSPGPDGIPSEHVEEIYKRAPGILLVPMNTMLINEWVPDTWKLSRLVLINKEGKQRDDPAGYRTHLLSE